MTEYKTEVHGEPLVEWQAEPPDGWSYAITPAGWVLRRGDDGDFATYYHFNPATLPEQIASIRAASWQRITEDRYTGPVPEVDGATKVRRKPVAKTTAKTKTEEKPLRLGARAIALLAEQGLTGTKREQAIKAGTEFARSVELPSGKKEGMLRDYHLYGALGLEMPERIAEAWETYKSTGKEPAIKSGKAAPTGEEAPPSEADEQAPNGDETL